MPLQGFALLEHFEQVSNGQAPLRWMAHGPVQVEVITITSSLALPREIPCCFEVSDDLLSGPLRDAHPLADLARRYGWVLGDA